MECAKVIGLDSEYLAKLAEQKIMREAVLRRKEERRGLNIHHHRSSKDLKQNFGKKLSDNLLKRIEHKPTESIKDDFGRNATNIIRSSPTVKNIKSSINAEKFTEMKSDATRNNQNKISNELIKEGIRKKAYLAVVVATTNATEINEKLIKMFAEEAGRIKVFFSNLTLDFSNFHFFISSFSFHFSKIIYFLPHVACNKFLLFLLNEIPVVKNNYPYLFIVSLLHAFFL